jgi:exodeoxyribonuclease VII, small subunit
MANITPKDPVTLGLTTQRELDAAVAKAAKAAGAPAFQDTRLEGDRAALIDQLRAEREQHARDAEAALRRRRPATRRRTTKSCPASATRSRTRPLLDSRPFEGQNQSMATTEDVSQLSFEDALKRLEEIVRALEKGEAPLDRSIELYQEGDRLKRHCEARLKDAQARIEQIAFGSDGKPSGLKPFDAD